MTITALDVAQMKESILGMVARFDEEEVDDDAFEDAMTLADEVGGLMDTIDKNVWFDSNIEFD